LNDARPAGGFGVAAITYPDIDAWVRLTGRKPTPWEVGTLKALDRVFLKVMSEKRE